MVEVVYSKRAKADLAEIADFYTRTIDLSTALRILYILQQEIDQFANKTMLKGQVVPGTPNTRKVPIYRKRYLIYFRRQKNGKFRVLRVYNASRKPLTPQDIGN